MVWYGEKDVATLENIGGGVFAGDDSMFEEASKWMFDDDFSTFFVSHWDNNDNLDKHLLVTFNVSYTIRIV